MEFRSNTWDKDIYRCVHTLNEYKLPTTFNKKDVGIDIGAHIGSFSTACVERHIGKILAFEVHPENFKLLVNNTKSYSNVLAYNIAVWKNNTDRVSVPTGFPGQNTGGLPVREETHGMYTAPTITLDKIIENYDKIRIIKLDCEGSEFPILANFNGFEKVDEFVGEYHLHGQWTIQWLRDLFELHGFSTNFEKSTDALGHFWATKNG